MEWTEDTISSLRRFWSEGHSTAEIGRRLGVTKNAVVGKAHRLILAPRPSPIRRDADATPAPRRVTGPTLPPTPSLPAEAAPPPAAVAAPGAAVVPAAPPAMEARAPLRPAALPARSSRVSTCCWPIGEPGTRSFHFCDDAAMTGRPYCEAHALLAYVKVRDRREDAA